MMSETILVVEDEDDVAELIRYNLEREGYRVVTTSTGEAAFDEAVRSAPNLVLLDLMLPGLDGLEICRRLKSDNRTAKIPVIMVTALGEEADVVAGLQLGAEDYVVKPFSPRVLLARTGAVLRRWRETPDDGKATLVAIHPGHREGRGDDQRVELSASEFKILNFLARMSAIE
jgi:two-component system phosphate regulon response regulator PhoB